MAEPGTDRRLLLENHAFRLARARVLAAVPLITVRGPSLAHWADADKPRDAQEVRSSLGVDYRLGRESGHRNTEEGLRPAPRDLLPVDFLISNDARERSSHGEPGGQL